MRAFTILSACCIILSACSDSNVAQVTPDLGIIIYHPLKQIHTDSSALVASSRVSARASMEIHGILTSSTDWRARHGWALSMIEELERMPYSESAIQSVSLRMLDVLLQESASSDLQEAMVRYVETLLRYENPDASVLIPAIDALGNGRWSPEHVHAQKQKARQYALAFLERTSPSLGRATGCDGCADETMIEADDARAHRIRLIRRYAG